MKLVYFILISHVCYSSSALHMVRYGQMNADFRRFTFYPSAYPEDDPLNLASIEVRENICDRVITAKQYVTLSIKKKIPSQSEENPPSVSLNYQRINNLPGNPDPNYLQYIPSRVKLYGQAQCELIKRLQCLHTNDKDWFVTFGGKGERMFLLEPRRSLKSVLTVSAILEPRPNYKVIRSRQDEQWQYFANLVEQDMQPVDTEHTKIFRRRRIAVPKKMTLCHLTFHEHSRLCSAVFDTLSQPEVGKFQDDMRHVNYHHVRSDLRCLIKTIKIATQGIMRAQVLPCSINRTFLEPQFFVLADPKVPGAAFILVEKKNRVNGLKLIAYVENIVVLLDQEDSSRQDSD